jgi:hypothetical protein
MADLCSISVRISSRWLSERTGVVDGFGFMVGSRQRRRTA